MESDSGETTSIWMATAEEIPSDGNLTADARADDTYVGAGIAGMTTAYLLAREGKAVIVLDDGPIGGGMTGRTTAHLVNALDDRFYELERLHGERGSRLAAESHSAAIDRVETIVKAEGIEPVNDRFVIHTKQAPYITYVIGARVPRSSVTKALYWDTPDPYHYVRLESVQDGKESYDVLIVGGEDHKTGQADDANRRFVWLERWTRTRFPMIEGIEFQWSGQVMEPIDALAFIGRNPLDEENVFIATGDSGNGMTHGTIAGMLLTDLIMGRENEWATLYDPARKTLRALPEFAGENLNVAAQYLDLVTPGEVDSADEIKAGEGAVVRRGLKKVAVYRDDAGLLHERSAVCVHLGCIVDWNSKEKTWDCPCHGSRYDAYGKVFQGPANGNLSPVDED